MVENVEHRIRRLGTDVIALGILAGAGKLLANIIINTSSGAVTGHINAPCVADPGCMNMVVDTVRLLPAVLPALYALGKVVGGIVTRSCSDHPDGGVNQSISGQLE